MQAAKLLGPMWRLLVLSSQIHKRPSAAALTAALVAQRPTFRCWQWEESKFLQDEVKRHRGQEIEDKKLREAEGRLCQNRGARNHAPAVTLHVAPGVPSGCHA